MNVREARTSNICARSSNKQHIEDEAQAEGTRRNIKRTVGQEKEKGKEDEE